MIGERPNAIFTLDPAGAKKRLWYAVFPENVLGQALPVEDLLDQLVDSSMDAVKTQVPSLDYSSLTVGSEKDPSGGPQLFAFGQVQFRRSEWDALTRESRGKLRAEGMDI